jgi:hypothetical protein
VDDSNPDFPPLVDAYDATRAQGGLVLWCHSGNGMEAPIAAMLGRLDALNLFDPYWMDPEYDLWYALLNCGIRLPASTVDWAWHESLDRIEIIRDGDVVATCSPAADEARGVWSTTLDTAGGWLAARAWGERRTSYGHALWAHTSPVYLRPFAERDRVRTSSQYFLERIDTATDWLARQARFDLASQRERMLTLFAEGRSAYAALLAH